MPNHPPTPVLNLLGVTLPSQVECDALKVEHGVETRQHRKGASKASGQESHHILQDAAMKDLIGKYSGWAVLLDGSSGGFHDQINAKQIARNCGPSPPKNFGELVVASRDDLKDTFKADGKSDAVAQKLADCLTMEAVNHTQEKREAKGNPPLEPSTPVAKVSGCLAAETLIWMADGSRLPASAIRVGMAVNGGHVVRRTDGCSSSLIALQTEHGPLRLTPTHRLRLAEGSSVRADRVTSGALLSTAGGTSRVLRVSRERNAEQVYTFDFARAIQLPVASAGILADMPELAPALREIVDLKPPPGMPYAAP